MSYFRKSQVWPGHWDLQPHVGAKVQPKLWSTILSPVPELMK